LGPKTVQDANSTKKYTKIESDEVKETRHSAARDHERDDDDDDDGPLL
jgi:hypothetical protein